MKKASVSRSLNLIGGGENRTGMANIRSFIDKSGIISFQFTQILRTHPDQTGYFKKRSALQTNLLIKKTASISTAILRAKIFIIRCKGSRL